MFITEIFLYSVMRIMKKGITFAQELISGDCDDSLMTNSIGHARKVYI